MLNSRSAAWIMWLTASIFYAYQYILRVMPSVLLDDIMQQFSMNTTIFGQFSGIYYIGYSLMHIPLGIMLDKYGPKKIIPVCILLSATGTLPLIFGKEWIFPTIGRVITGIGSSAAILGTFKIIRMAFDEKRFTRMLSFSVTIGVLGAIYGGSPVRAMCGVFGYGSTIGILAAVGAVLAGVAFFVIPDTEEEGRGDSGQSMFSGLRDVLTNWKVIITCFSSGLMVGPLEGFADIWGPKFLNRCYGIDGTKAGYLTSMIFIGMCFGAPVLNFIAEKIGYIRSIIFSAITMFIIFVMLLTKVFNTLSLTVCFVIVGVCSAYQILAIYKVSTYVSKNTANLTTAVANMIIMIFGYVFHGIIGGVINIFSESGMDSAFCYGIAAVPAGLLIGAFGFMIISRAESRENS
ncbi:MAG: MFS transporter [Holosporaceae bacterium]|jgi:predicted MFS family arabinose efflux permease|nr:MFS transporter [Holosporaceae bacterium]